MPKDSKRKWNLSVRFFHLVFLRGLFNVPEKPGRCSSVCLYFISCSKILCCDRPLVKEEKIGFLILIGQWGNTCRVTNLLSFIIEHGILLSCVSCLHSLEYEIFFLYYLGHNSKIELQNSLLDETLISFLLIFLAVFLGTQKPQTCSLKQGRKYCMCTRYFYLSKSLSKITAKVRKGEI